jgi:hypothetical protein
LTHELEPSTIIVRGAFRTIIQAEYRRCGAKGTLAAQAMLSRARASEQLLVFDRMRRLCQKGNVFANASEMFAPCVHSPREVPPIASQQALIQFGSEHLQFDRTGSANIYPAPHRATPTRLH